MEEVKAAREEMGRILRVMSKNGLGEWRDGTGERRRGKGWMGGYGSGRLEALRSIARGVGALCFYQKTGSV